MIETSIVIIKIEYEMDGLRRAIYGEINGNKVKELRTGEESYILLLNDGKEAWVDKEAILSVLELETKSCLYEKDGLENALTVVNQTVRGDLSKNYYPKLKSTYFAMLVSLANLGQTVGTIAGAGLFALFALFTNSFNLIFFFVSVFCSVSLLASYLIFRKIDPLDYELRS